MKSKKLLICLVFLFVSLFAFSFKANVKADIITIDSIKVEGAQIRSTGNAGIRFVASSLFDGADGYGILLAFGETAADESFVVNGTVNGKEVANVEFATAEEGQFAVTLYDIPEVYYTQAVSARAYVKLGEEYLYAEEVCVKSLAEVALKAKADGDTSELVTTVSAAVEKDYKYYSASDTEVVLIDLPLLSSLELAALEAEFIADLNENYGTSLTASSTADNYYSALGSAYKNDLTDSNVYKFFVSNEATSAKWGWLIKFINVKAAKIPHVLNQSNALLIENPVYQEGVHTYELHNGRHLSYALYNFFNQDTYSNYPTLTFPNEEAYSGLDEYYRDNLTAIFDSLVKVGSTITLPAALEKEGYTFNGWSDGTNTLEAGSQYTVTADNVKINPDFTAIEYEIRYYNGTEEYTELAGTYTIADKVVLPAQDDAGGYVFAGWYDNAEFTGTPVESIAKGTSGDKVYYAKWVFGFDTIVADDDYASLAAGTKVTVDGTEYTVGSDAQATIAAALTVAKDNATIYVAAGTYSDALSIAKSITIIGANKELVLTHDSVYASSSANDSIITGTVKIEAGTNNVTIKGFVMDNQVALYGNDTVTISYVYFETPASSIESLAGAVLVKGVSSNLTVDHVYYKGNLYRFINIFYQLTNLTCSNSVIMDESTGMYDAIRVQNGIKVLGNYIVKNNYFQKASQVALYSLNTYSCNYEITDNVFVNCGGGIYFRRSEEAGISYNISYNTFDGCGKVAGDWYVIQINSENTSNVKQESIITINYNKFLANVNDPIYVEYALTATNAANNYFDPNSDDNTCTYATNYEQVAEESACGPRQ